MSKAYLQSGVSPDKEEVHAALAETDTGLYPGAFCKIVADPSGDPAYASILHADGAGTKSIVAYLEYRERGTSAAFEGLAQDSAVMNVDDLACVGALGPLLLSNTIGRNAHRVDGEAIRALIRGYERFAERMRRFGIELVTAGGETADIGDLVQTVVVDATIYARIARAQIVDVSRIAPGHAIVGLASDGQAAYEDRRTSGIGSNGLTLARHVLLHSAYGERYPETVSSTLARGHAYRGRHRLEDELPGTGMSVGEALLSPTRTYAPIVRELLAAQRASISGLIHCSGGGQTKCLRFGRDLHYVKDRLFAPPPLFRAIQAEGRIELEEMLQVFNMGHRMEVYCEPSAVEAVLAIARRHAVAAQVIGEVRRSSRPGRNELSAICEGRELVYTRPLASARS